MPEEKILDGEAVAIRCVHGDTVLYPLAQMEVSVGGQALEVKVAVSDTLPMDMLLNTDVPELGELLDLDIEHFEVMAVTTHAQGLKQKDLQGKDLRSGANVTEIAEPSITGPEWMDTFDDELFEGGREKVKLSQSQD